MRSYTLVNPNTRASANSHRPRTRSSPSIQSPSRTCYRSSSNISTASSSSSSSSGSMVNSTTTSPILKPKIIRSNDQVRSKFLSKIGIVDVSTSANASSTSFAYLPSSSPPAHSRDPQSIPRYREPLKYNRQEERLRHERKSTPVFSPVWLSTPNNSIIDAFASLKGEVDNDWSNGNYDVSWTRKNKSNERKKKISFEESVHVVPIPMRSEYSDRIRNRLWNNAVEIHENAARNALEFAAENWDWRTVYHEEDMYICCITGELIHPAHYQSRSQPLPILGRSD